MIDSLLEYAKSQKVSLEVISKRKYEVDITCFNGVKNEDNTSDITFYLLKGIIDGKLVELQIEDISDPKYLIDKMRVIAELLDETEEITFENLSFSGKKKRLPQLNLKEIEDKLVSFGSYLEKYPLLKAITTEFVYSYESLQIQNTMGLNLKDQFYSYNLVSEVVCQDGEKSENDVFFTYQDELNFEESQRKVLKSIEKCQLKLEAKSVASKKYTLVLSNKCVYDILKNFKNAFQAENIQNKMSVFNDDFGKKIFNSKVTIVENPFYKKAPVQRTFDNEGVLMTKKTIIEKGVFKTKLYHNQSASKDKTVSTGNKNGVVNMYLKPGRKSEEELILLVKDGIYIDHFLGLNSGINVMNGTISLPSFGRKICNGKLTDSIHDIVLSTDIKELFSNVLSVANNLEFFDLPGGAPSILVEDISIIGVKEVTENE